MEDAIVLHDSTSRQAIPKEYALISGMFGEEGVEWILTEQELLEEDGHFYDRMDIVLENGEEKSVFFDISKIFKRANKEDL